MVAGQKASVPPIRVLSWLQRVVVWVISGVSLLRVERLVLSSRAELVCVVLSWLVNVSVLVPEVWQRSVRLQLVVRRALVTMWLMWCVVLATSVMGWGFGSRGLRPTG